MNREEALAIVKPQLRLPRYEHTIRVTDTAINLAEKYQESAEAVILAAVFHDYAKYRDVAEMRQLIASESKLPDDLLTFHHELWHGPVGALLVGEEVGITDQAILDAIRWHTTGTANMSKIEKIVYLADYIEPARKFVGLEQVRSTAETNLDYACFLAVRNTIQFLTSKERSIYPATLNMYNDLIKQMGE